MKKNFMMRVASALLVAVLLTTCVISGTYAKYTTSSTGTDSARVAYWGFENISSLTIDLFDGNYTNVKASGEVGGFSNVIAPGTSKSTTFAFGYDYKEYGNGEIKAPEVAYTFKVEPTITGNYTSLDNNPNFKWTLQAPGDASVIEEYDTVAELLTAIKNLSGSRSGTQTYAPGNLPDNFNSTNEQYTIGWKWAFETEDDTTTTDKNEMNEQDATDTAMGMSKDDQGKDVSLGNVKFTITISATQVD